MLPGEVAYPSRPRPDSVGAEVGPLDRRYTTEPRTARKSTGSGSLPRLGGGSRVLCAPSALRARPGRHGHLNEELVLVCAARIERLSIGRAGEENPPPAAYTDMGPNETNATWAVDTAFERLLIAAEELHRAARLAQEAKDDRDTDDGSLARASDYGVEAINAVVRRSSHS